MRSNARDVTFDIRDIPFSRQFSWLNVSPVVAENTVLDDLHLVTHHGGLHAVLSLQPWLDGTRVDTVVHTTAVELSWLHRSGRVRAGFESPDTVRITGTGLQFRVLAAQRTLTPFSGPFFFTDPVDSSLTFTHYESGGRYRITALRGHLEALGDQALGTAERGLIVSGADDGSWEIAIETLGTARPSYRNHTSFDEMVQVVAAEFDDYLEAVTPWRSPATPAAALAAYVLWSATVGPAGFVTRPTVFMSKHWMDKVWSWDHCFNAIALAAGRPELALDQFRIVFDHQDASGALPDSVTHSEVLYNFVKPPIHGWALTKIRARLPAPLPPADLALLYRQLSDWTRFWLDFRRAPGRVLAHYQHGNDSGWDNSTTFDSFRVAETADLAAFLAQQLGVLHALATELNFPQEAARWGAEQRAILTAMVDELWRDGQFQARSPHTGQRHRSASLLNLLPIALGADLPDTVRHEIVVALKRHLTHWGPATEPVDSPEYRSDGYWRGPIWAPSTALVEDGLRRAGEIELADEISERFRLLCETSGFAENFDAVTGAGLRDRAYTWTASVYLTLAADAEIRRLHRTADDTQRFSSAPS